VKVEDSMENLEEVVKERNRAYYELETGTTGSVHANFS
jgi:large subunit ribosomal protein L47